jgi:hypothetical protein
MVEITARGLRVPTALASLVRGLTHANLPLGLTACGVVGTLGFANGGFFPVSWGWSGLALLALLAVALAVGISVETEALDKVFLTALAALATWIALSLLWTNSVTRTVQENERMLVYLGGGAAAVLLLRRRSVNTLLFGVWAAIAVVSTYGLATRLFPDQIGSYDPVSVYRLSSPVGYWNALGIIVSIGALVALGFAARGNPTVRCLAAASTVIFMVTLYFTFSRGSWIAFFFGLAVAIALDRRRLQLITTLLALTPWSVIGVWAASRSPALTHLGASLNVAASDGHGLAVIVIGLVVAAALTILALDWLESAVSVPHRAQRVYVGTLLFVVAALVIVVFGQYGFPPTLARKAYDAFNAAPITKEQDLNSRLFSFSGNGRSEYWHTAWEQAEDKPLLGSGAGTYSEFWFQHRRIDDTVHDAHNLYLETLSELGPVGLLMLVVLLGAPLVAMRRARSSPLAGVACAAYAAYLLHAAGDWDWEMPAITLSALFCGIALLAAARREREPRPLLVPARVSMLTGAIALLGFGLLGLLGNIAISASSTSTDSGHLARAESEAKRATHLAGWSSEPWRKLAEAQLIAGDRASARASFRKAIEKDSGDWTLWYELTDATTGAERRHAFAEASRLNPRDNRLRPDSTGAYG